MGLPIVQVIVEQVQAPTPNTLQRKGAFISNGATTESANTLTLITQLSDLTSILKAPAAITSLDWSANVVTVTTAAPHGYTDAQVIPMTIAGATPSGYNGNFLATITGASTFTYPLVSNPGMETVPGTYVVQSAAEVLAMGTTFFAQGSQQSVYVLELGGQDNVDAIAAFNTWLTNNPGQLYAYLVPAEWSGESTYLTLVGNYEALTAKTYFFTTMTTGNYTTFTSAMKCVFGMIEAPATPSTEFSCAAAFYRALAYQPSATNRVTPFAYGDLFGVTQYPQTGNQALLTALKAAGVNVVGNGSEGGLTNAILFWGTTMDVRDFSYWFNVDWMQINPSQALANAVINGANNPANPLYYNQDGINRLQNVVAGQMTSGVSYGIVLNPIVLTKLDPTTLMQNYENGVYDGLTVVNAWGFQAYSAANPNDYKTGLYSGLTVIAVPARGFTAIIFNLLVTDFVAS